MEKELNELYRQLADQLNSMIPVDWNQIYYLGEVEGGQKSWSSVFYFEESESSCWVRAHSIPEKFEVSQAVYDEFLQSLNVILLEINNCFEKNDQPVWDQLVFYLTNEGQFNVDFLYNQIKDNDQVEREVIWAYKTFGLKPKPGTFMGKILDRYLASNS